MAHIIISSQADEDSDDITEYLKQEAGKTTAAKYAMLFEDLFIQLSEFPESGAPRPQLGRLVRLSVVAPYVVIYRYIHATDTVTVARILHGSRRITPRLLRSR